MQQTLTHMPPIVINREDTFVTGCNQLNTPLHNQPQPISLQQHPSPNMPEYQIITPNLPTLEHNSPPHTQLHTMQPSTHPLAMSHNPPQYHHLANHYSAPPQIQYEHYGPPQEQIHHHTNSHQIIVQNQLNHISVQQSIPSPPHSQYQIQQVTQLPVIKHNEVMQPRQIETNDTRFKVLEQQDQLVEVHHLQTKQSAGHQLQESGHLEEQEQKISIVYDPNQFRCPGEQPHHFPNRIHVTNASQQYIQQPHTDSVISSNINGLKSYMNPYPFKVPLSQLCPLGPMMNGCPAIVI